LLHSIYTSFNERTTAVIAGVDALGNRKAREDHKEKSGLISATKEVAFVYGYPVHLPVDACKLFKNNTLDGIDPITHKNIFFKGFVVLAVQSCLGIIHGHST
jgi:hypothetical protein